MRIRLCSILLLLLVAGAAWAQDLPQPDRPRRCALPPGGAPDLVGRTLANRLSERLGQPFVVENRTGAGGNIAAEAVAKSTPDGYTLLATSDGPLVINPSVCPTLPFDTLRDFADLHRGERRTCVDGLSVTCRLERGVVALAKQKKLTYASSGYGSSQHVAASSSRIRRRLT